MWQTEEEDRGQTHRHCHLEKALLALKIINNIESRKCLDLYRLFWLCLTLYKPSILPSSNTFRCITYWIQLVIQLCYLVELFLDVFDRLLVVSGQLMHVLLKFCDFAVVLLFRLKIRENIESWRTFKDNKRLFMLRAKMH